MGDAVAATAPAAADSSTTDANGRPTAILPFAQLFQISIYWLGLNVVWGGWEILGQERIEELVPRDIAGTALGVIEFLAVIVAIIVQPTIGNLSDYTMSRWGRRKPYIFIGTCLDVLFLVLIALTQTYLAFFVALVLLQFSANFAQGPFQGYVPDLVPERQVGTASALVGMMSIFGNIVGTIVVVVGFAIVGDYFWPTVTLGVIELATMLGTILWVREGRAAKPREGRSWTAIALETWGTDILRERSYVWLVASRLFFLIGSGTLVNLVVWYTERSLGLTPDVKVTIPFIADPVEQKAVLIPLATAVFGLTILLITLPAARVSDRVGRKPVIWAACAIGAAGMGILGLAPTIPIVLAGVVLVGAAAGTFLAVDWAFMTELVPKASAGRYMGMSNVATASATALAPAIGGVVMDQVGAVAGLAAGPRAAYLVAIAFFALAALLLWPVVEPRRRGASGLAGGTATSA